jgi:hypothetical protein
LFSKPIEQSLIYTRVRIRDKVRLARLTLNLQMTKTKIYTAKPVLGGHIWDKEKWSFKTGDLLTEVQLIWNFIWQNKKNVTFYCRLLLNRGDRMDRFYCLSSDANDRLLSTYGLRVISPTDADSYFFYDISHHLLLRINGFLHLLRDTN